MLKLQWHNVTCTEQMYSSYLSLEPALHHHHLGVEAQVEYEALWVLV